MNCKNWLCMNRLHDGRCHEGLGKHKICLLSEAFDEIYDEIYSDRTNVEKIRRVWELNKEAVENDED